jgi:8-oxo-dGTP pyrophosphatase MutT (NUDIX family)
VSVVLDRPAWHARAWPPDRIAARARLALRDQPPAGGDVIARPRSDFDLDGDGLTRMAAVDEMALKPAAVLVPVVAHRTGATLLFTQRAARLRAHAAQIAFPGGRIDAADADPLEAALREAQEEVGLPPSRVTPLGYLDAYLTGTGYRITPVVALVEPGATLTLNPAEVDEVFEAPFGFFMDQAHHQRHGRAWQGRWRSFYAMPWGHRYIWGATAGILRNLHDRFAAVPDRD